MENYLEKQEEGCNSLTRLTYKILNFNLLNKIAHCNTTHERLQLADYGIYYNLN